MDPMWYRSCVCIPKRCLWYRASERERKKSEVPKSGEGVWLGDGGEGMVEIGAEDKSVSEHGGVMLGLDWGLVIMDLSGFALQASGSTDVSDGGGDAGEYEPAGLVGEKVG
jgi:hypothetical protein